MTCGGRNDISLLHDIRDSVLRDEPNLGSIILKLRLLATCLGSQPFEEWVRYESEGYPEGVHVPAYRVIPVKYNATLTRPGGSVIRNAPVPPYLVEKFAGSKWLKYEFRENVAAVEDLLETSKDTGSLHFDASDLIFLLQGKFYEGYAINQVVGIFSRHSIASLRLSTLGRILQLTLEIERSLPEALSIDIEKTAISKLSNSNKASQIVYQIVYGNATTIYASDSARVNVAVSYMDTESLVKFLTENGLPKSDAKQIGKLIASEQPNSREEPLGARSTEWLLRNLRKAVNGTWKIGVTVATEVIKKAALKYYGLE